MQYIYGVLACCSSGPHLCLPPAIPMCMVLPAAHAISSICISPPQVTPLHMAAARGHLAAVTRLLEHGAPQPQPAALNSLLTHGSCCVNVAPAKHPQLSCCDANAEVDTRCCRRQPCSPRFRPLLAADAGRGRRSARGDGAAADVSCERLRSRRAVRKVSDASCRMYWRAALLFQGLFQHVHRLHVLPCVLLRQAVLESRTCLHWACQNGHLEAARLLLRNGMVRPVSLTFSHTAASRCAARP